MIKFKLLNLCGINLHRLYKPSYFVVITFIGLSGCSHVQPPNLNRNFDKEHFNKDLVISFPGWMSEDSKLAELDEAAKSKGRIKCNNSPYSLVEIYSNRFTGFWSPTDLRNNAISANILCGPSVQVATNQPLTTTDTTTSTSSPSVAPSKSVSQSDTSSGSSTQTAKSVYALVIGNGQYKKDPLLNPTNDAKEIAKRFTQYGFTVRLVLDGDRKTLIKALNDFQSQSINFETNILFYAGHGIQFNGVNYVIPTDMSLDAGTASIDFDAISTNQIIDRYMRGKTKLVFLDACRDNPLARTFVASRGVGSINKGLAPMDVASGTLISYATKDGNVAADGFGQNSPYTESLLKYLDNREDISLILRKVRQDVINKTKGQQVPWDYGSLVGGQLILSNK